MTTRYLSSNLSQLKLQRHVFFGSRSVRLLNYVGLLTLFGIALAVSYSVYQSYVQRGEPLEDVSFIYEIPLFGFSFAQIFFGAAIIAYICSEWSSGFIYTTYGATQKPLNFIIAKLVWPVLFALLTLTILLIVTVPLEHFLISRDTPYGISLFDPTVVRQILVANFNLASSVLFAGGLALSFRQTAPALGCYIAVSLIAPIVFGLIPLKISEFISRWLPNSVYNYLNVADPILAEKLNYPLLLGVAAAYPVIAITIGFLRLKRKPI